jgi:predicted transcriptional regulator
MERAVKIVDLIHYLMKELGYPKWTKKVVADNLGPDATKIGDLLVNNEGYIGKNDIAEKLGLTRFKTSRGLFKLMHWGNIFRLESTIKKNETYYLIKVSKNYKTRRKNASEN